MCVSVSVSVSVSVCVAGLYLMLKMHFVSQNYHLSAEEVPRAGVDAMHYGLRAQMIHEKKGTHACHLWSKNWDFSELLLEREKLVCCVP